MARSPMAALTTIFLFALFAGAVDAEVPTRSANGGSSSSIDWDMRLANKTVDLLETDPLLARSVQTPFQPEQIRLTLGGANEMRVTWITGLPQYGPQQFQFPDVNSIPSIVKYGTDQNNLDKTATGFQTAYQTNYNFTGPLVGAYNYTSATIHHTKLSNLTPNTLYFYQCSDGTDANKSPVLNFTSAPPTGNTSFPIRTVWTADLGQTPNTSATLDHLQAEIRKDYSGAAGPLVFLVGDVCYADNYLSNGTVRANFPGFTFPFQTYQPRWDTFGRLIEPISRQYPWMVGQGNHEIELAGGDTVSTSRDLQNILAKGDRTFASLKARYLMPYQESNSTQNFVYSFDYGPVHFISISMYTWPDYDQSSVQYQWLLRDLKAINREVTPWVVAYFHNPWYNTFAGAKQMECFRIVMEPLLYQFGVNFVFSGHVHSYERFYPTYNWQYDPCGPIYITIGDGGNNEGLSIGYADNPGKCTESTPVKEVYYFQDDCPTYNTFNGSQYCPLSQPGVSAYREPSFGFGILDFVNATTAYWQWHRNQDLPDIEADNVYYTLNSTQCRAMGPRTTVKGQFYPNYY